MSRLKSVNDMINSVAVEVGLNSDGDPIASPDELFVQFRELLNSAGQEMVELHTWQVLRGVFNLVTKEGDTGTYDLPDDFSYMIDQTGWDKSNRVAIGGPLSAQDWSYLDGRDLVSQSIYASFRLVENKFDLYPQPPPEGLIIRFEYISRNWLAQAVDQSLRNDEISTGSDIILFEPILMRKFLKVKWLEAKGFDSSSARLEFETVFLARTGHDEGSSILSASHNSRGFPYLHPFYNTGDSGYGGVP